MSNNVCHKHPLAGLELNYSCLKDRNPIAVRYLSERGVHLQKLLTGI